MALTLDVDPRIVHEQIALLRGSLATARLNPRQRYLVVNLLNFLQTVAKAPDEHAPAT